MEMMNKVVNSKRVFGVKPHRPIGYGEMLGQRGDIRLDMLGQESRTRPRLRFCPPRMPIRSARRATNWRRNITPTATCWRGRRTC